jgi:hypothetical protein
MRSLGRIQKFIPQSEMNYFVLLNFWQKWSGYHRCSLVETKMHCIKLLGDKLMARSFPSQVNEIHARVAVLNIFTELGRPHTQVFT